MLEAAGLWPGDVLLNLGCGDGRIPVVAAKLYGIRAIGVDIDPGCVLLARKTAKLNRIDELATFWQGDARNCNCRGATVLVLSLPPSTVDELYPRLRRLPPGVRVVAGSKCLPNWLSQNVVRIDDEQTECLAEGGMSNE